MPKKIQLHIPKPCHEDWDKMTTAEKGKYCNSCQKNVIDFTGMSDSQLVAYFKEPRGSSVCGMLSSDQLNREIMIHGKRLPWLNHLLKMVIPAILISSTAKSQGKIRLTGETILVQSDIKSVDKTVEKEDIFIKGTVTDENKKPLPYTSVIVKGTIRGTVCDANGQYVLTLSEPGKNVTIQFSCVGYLTQEVNITKLLKENVKEINFSITLNETLCTQVLGFVSPVIVKKKEKKGPVSLVKMIFADSIPKKIKLYPNPVRSGENLIVEFKDVKAGRYKAYLLAQSGQQVYSTELFLDEKRGKKSLKVPIITPGNYILRIFNTESKKIYTEKLIIQ